MRAAQRAAVRLARARGEQTPLEPEHRDFPCAFLCSSCGQLHPPLDPTAGHPTRRNIDVAKRPGAPCSHCGAQGWIDLANVAMADILRDSERAHQSSRPRVLTLLPVLLSLLSAVVTARIDTSHGRSIAGFLGAESALPLWPLVALALLGVFVGAGLWRRHQHRRRLPHRWSLAPSRAAGPRRRGHARSGPTLRAPLTGRPCVAYELAIHTADEPDAPLGEFTLVEQRCADLEVEGKRFAGDRVRLSLRRQRIELDPTNDTHRRAMQVRGLEPVGDAFTVYETIVAPKAPVAVAGTEHAATLRAA